MVKILASHSWLAPKFTQHSPKEIADTWQAKSAHTTFLREGNLEVPFLEDSIPDVKIITQNSFIFPKLAPLLGCHLFLEK